MCIRDRSWADAPITNVVVRNASIEYTGGGTADQGKKTVTGPGVDARMLPAWGFYARNAGQITLEDVRLSLATADLRPVVLADRVQTLHADNVRFTSIEGVTMPLVTTNVSKVKLRNSDLRRP